MGIGLTTTDPIIHSDYKWMWDIPNSILFNSDGHAFVNSEKHRSINPFPQLNVGSTISIVHKKPLGIYCLLDGKFHAFLPGPEFGTDIWGVVFLGNVEKISIIQPGKLFSYINVKSA